jgi:hypothetical protein
LYNDSLVAFEESNSYLSKASFIYATGGISLQTIITAVSTIFGLAAMAFGIYIYQEKSVTQKTRVIFSVILFVGLFLFLLLNSLIESHSANNSGKHFWAIFWEYLKIREIFLGFLLIIIMPAFYHFYSRRKKNKKFGSF